MEVVGLAVNTGTSLAPPNKEEDDEDKDHPVSPLLPSSSFIKASSSQTARLPQRDWQSIPQSWGTYKAYLKIEAHKNYTSNPQKGGGARADIDINFEHTNPELIGCESQSINS